MLMVFNKLIHILLVQLIHIIFRIALILFKLLLITLFQRVIDG